jgi:hypothetical protein
MQDHESEMAIVIKNARSSTFPLILEPWGYPYEMPAQASYSVEVEFAADFITVWVSDGCLFAVYCNGEALPPGAFEGPAVPAGAAIIKDAILRPRGMSSTDPDANPARDFQDVNRTHDG